jgi:hypothetical protein
MPCSCGTGALGTSTNRRMKALISRSRRPRISANASRDLRPRVNDLVDRRLIQSVADQLGLRDDRVAPVLAGHHTALAEGAAGVNGPKELPWLFRDLHPHLGLAGCQQVEPVGRVALVIDDVAAGKWGEDQMFADRPQLFLLQAGKQLELAQIGHPRSVSRRRIDLR